MKFLDKLGLGQDKSGGKKRPPGTAAPAKKSTSGAPAKKRPVKRKGTARGVAAPKAPTPKPLTKPKSSVEDKLITKIDNLPAYERIISDEDDEMSLPKSLRRDYLILLTNEKHKSVDIICSVESSQVSRVDANFMSIRDDLRECGFKYGQRLFASRPLLKLMYEKSAATRGDEKVIANAGELEKDFDALLKNAVEQGVSDIHIEVRRDTAVVRVRRNGMLYMKHEWGVQYARDLAVVTYQVIAEEKDVTFVPSIPQDAVIDRSLDGVRVRVRLATAPAYPDGFDMVMRVLPMGMSTGNKTIGDLGYTPQQVKDIEVMMAQPVGALIISGVTGSGKSTSMATMLIKKIRDHQGMIKVITVENPPENTIPGATQMPVVLAREGRGGGNPFAAAIKAAMRSDPDVLMIGEVRDEDSAELLVHATQSGHWATTTLHTPAAFAIPGRLRSLGTANDVLGSDDFFAGLIYQTLAQTVCKKCCMGIEKAEQALRGTPDEESIKRVRAVFPASSLSSIKFRSRSGCDACEAGVAGRTVVAEAVYLDDVMKRHIGKSEDSLARIHWLKKGGRTVLHNGIDKVLAGICDPIDMERKVGWVDGIYELLRIADLDPVELGFNPETKKVDL